MIMIYDLKQLKIKRLKRMTLEKKSKPYPITKAQVWEAYKLVKGKGPPGVDGVTIDDIGKPREAPVPGVEPSSKRKLFCPRSQAARNFQGRWQRAHLRHPHHKGQDCPDGDNQRIRIDCRTTVPQQFIWIPTKQECASGH